VIRHIVPALPIATIPWSRVDFTFRRQPPQGFPA
jgi:hypothetical protein